ncbi:Endoribonuclease Dicer [Citrus sinensis]|uniref:Endoribonuclease Dicer n=1 Tax=Citrus sinensis TaxID=2711 RepID=A0ACB8JNB6_CITSI|nr:Endoribonuclease Dicer [Citrus sinensis]
MEPVSMESDTTEEVSADTLPFARNYQLEALENALKQNTIVFLETGSGKTLIAIMLLRSYAYLLRKPSPFVAVFLVPKVVLVPQQAEAIKMHTDLKVGKYWGDMGVDFWDGATWKEEISKHEVLVMTPQILLDGLRLSYFKLNMIKEFYHRLLETGDSNLPRIFGMTASPIKSKVSSSEQDYWQKIHDLETLMNSKVYTCASESVLSNFIPFSTAKFKFYKYDEIPHALYTHLADELAMIELKHTRSLENLDLNEAQAELIRKKVSKINSTLLYCLSELGVWLALKAAETISCYESDFFAWEQLDGFGETIIKKFGSDASQALVTYVPSGAEWSIGDDSKFNLDSGLLTEKIVCLIESLLEYRGVEDIRCIIFVERVITAIVLQSLLSELLPRHCTWKTKYIAGNNSGIQCQSRKKQNEIVEEFRRGLVNVIVATSILEEGLDVQSCNLVIMFDPSRTVCSFIQSRGRARMQNSDYLLMVKSGDSTTQSRLENYLASGNKMRKEVLSHASLPCSPLNNHMYGEDFYHVESTGTIATLSSSVSLIYFYCSRLPSDGYFKPTPKFDINKEMGICTLYLPNNCPIQTVIAQGNIKTLKQAACLEACKKLHQIGALTDNLLPDIVVEKHDAQKRGNEPYNAEHPIYLPPELVNQSPQDTKITYHCYLIELKQHFNYDISARNIVLAMRTELESEIKKVNFDLEVERGRLTVNLKHLGRIQLKPNEVLLCRKFQITLFRVIMDHNLDKLNEILDGFELRDNLEIDYLLLPSTGQLIDWKTVASVLFPRDNGSKHNMNCSNARIVHTKSGPLCTCKIHNSLVCTPHNGQIYCITGVLGHLKANSLFTRNNGSLTTYKKHYEERYGIQLCFDREPLLNGRRIFHVQNYLSKCRQQKQKEPSKISFELPPELCRIIMAPISLSTFYSFTFVPSIMHRLQSLLLAVNLKNMLLDHCMQNVTIPTIKVLEAITTKKCQEDFHLESLETLGDSFLKYAASQQLFKTYQNNHEGLLSVKKERIISNAALCKLGCEQKLPGFIRTESFDPKMWIIPGDNSGSYELNDDSLFNGRKIYVTGRKKVKSKTVADVVEALIGAFLSTGGENVGLIFLDRIGIKVDFVNVPYQRQFQVHAERLVNVRHLESLLNYSFRDPSLLVEALTHGSYMLPEIPRCYQRLEFLGDAVLDYLITVYLYNKYPGLSPGYLTDMRSASVNNDCYALSSVKHGLHKHILHASHELYKRINITVDSFEKLSLGSTFGWESVTSFPKALGDIIESLAGAIFVDSGCNREVVFQSIRPLLEPMITPETMRFHPVRELTEYCQKNHFSMKKPVASRISGKAAVTVEVQANGRLFEHTFLDADKKTAKKVACKEVLKSLRASFPGT